MNLLFSLLQTFDTNCSMIQVHTFCCIWITCACMQKIALITQLIDYSSWIFSYIDHKTVQWLSHYRKDSTLTIPHHWLVRKTETADVHSSNGSSYFGCKPHRALSSEMEGKSVTQSVTLAHRSRLWISFLALHARLVWSYSDATMIIASSFASLNRKLCPWFNYTSNLRHISF